MLSKKLFYLMILCHFSSCEVPPSYLFLIYKLIKGKPAERGGLPMPVNDYLL